MVKKLIALLCVALMMVGFAVIGYAEDAEETNILLGKTVEYNEDFGWFSDDVNDKFHPSHLVDGDVDSTTAVSNGKSAATLGGEDQIWFKIDLGALYDLSKVELVSRSIDWSDWDMDYTAIMISTEDIPVSEMTEVARTKGYWDNGGELTAGGTWSKDLSVSARYIAIYADNRYSGKIFACNEWRAYGKRNNNVLSGVAPKEVTGNFTIIPSFTPENVTDGNLSTICYTMVSSSPSFKYDLGEVKNIEKVEIYSRVSGGTAGEAGNVEIYGSKFDVPIKDMKLLTVTPANMGLNEVYSYVLPEVKAYRYLAIRCADARKVPGQNAEFIIAEFKAFDTEKEAVPDVVEPFEVNLAEGKPVNYNQDVTYLGPNYMPDKLTDGKLDGDGGQNFVYMVGGNANTNLYYIVDLESGYFIDRFQVVPRNGGDDAQAMEGYKIVGSMNKVPASEMEVIATIDVGNAEFNYTLENPKKYRYVGIYKEGNGRTFECSEFRAFSYAEAEYSAWSVVEAGTENEVSNIVAGKSYSVAIDVKNNFVNDAPTYIMLVGGYDKDGFMTTIKCIKAEMPPAPLSKTIMAENLYMPVGTVKMSVVLVDSMENAYMVVESCTLTAVE